MPRDVAGCAFYIYRQREQDVLARRAMITIRAMIRMPAIRCRHLGHGEGYATPTFFATISYAFHAMF